MTVLVTEDGRYQTSRLGRPLLARNSIPYAQWSAQTIRLAGEGRAVSFVDLYRTQPRVAAVVNKLCRQISRLPLKSYSRDANGDKQRLDAADHALPALLQRPAPRCGPVNLKQWVAMPALVHGNALLGLVRESAGAPPSALVPIDWRMVTPKSATQDGPVVVWEWTQDTETRYLAVEDTLHVAWQAPAGWLGVSPLEQLGVTLRLEDAAQRYANSSFDNAARPSGALVLPPDSRLNQAERQELREEIAATHGGVDNAFKMALLTGGMEWKPMGQTAVEAELIEQRRVNTEEINAVFDVPPPLVGDLEKATYSNITEQHKMLYETVLGPWLVLIEETIKAQIIDAYDPWLEEDLFVEFDLAEVLRGDTLKEVQALREAIQTGLMTPNEGRAVRNLPKSPEPAADQLYMPTNNMTPLGTSPPEPALDAPATDEEPALEPGPPAT